MLHSGKSCEDWTLRPFNPRSEQIWCCKWFSTGKLPQNDQLRAFTSFIAKLVPSLQEQNRQDTNYWLVARFNHSGFMRRCATVIAQNLSPFGRNRSYQAEEGLFEPGTTGGKGRSHAKLHRRHRTGREEDHPRNPCKDCESSQMSRERTYLEDLSFFVKRFGSWLHPV